MAFRNSLNENVKNRQLLYLRNSFAAAGKKDKVAHDFVLVSSKSAGLRWSLGQPLKWRTGRLFPRAQDCWKKANVAAFSDFLLVLFSTSSSDKTELGKNAFLLPPSLSFASQRNPNPSWSNSLLTLTPHLLILLLLILSVQG